MSLTIATAASNAVRDAHYESGVRSLLIEGSRTNLVPWSQDFSHWTPTGTPTRTPAALTLGALVLDLIGDDDAAGFEGYKINLAFTGDGTKAFSFHIAQGTSTSSVVQLWDATASVQRGLVAVTWSGGVPTVTPFGGASVLWTRPLSSGVYAVWCACSGIVAANTNQIVAYPATTSSFATANTGTAYLGGVQAEDAPFPSSYLVTSGAPVTRAADSLVLPFNLPPQEMTVYVKFVERGTYQLSQARILTIGADGSDVAPRFYLYTGSGNIYACGHQNAAGGTATNSNGSNAGIVIGATVELRGVLYADGSVQMFCGINGGAEITLGSHSAANPLAAAWARPKMYVGAAGWGTANSYSAFEAIRVIPGIQSLADCRATHGGILT